MPLGSCSKQHDPHAARSQARPRPPAHAQTSRRPPTVADPRARAPLAVEAGPRVVRAHAAAAAAVRRRQHRHTAELFEVPVRHRAPRGGRRAVCIERPRKHVRARGGAHEGLPEDRHQQRAPPGREVLRRGREDVAHAAAEHRLGGGAGVDHGLEGFEQGEEYGLRARGRSREGPMLCTSGASGARTASSTRLGGRVGIHPLARPGAARDLASPSPPTPCRPPSRQNHKHLRRQPPALQHAADKPQLERVAPAHAHKARHVSICRQAARARLAQQRRRVALGQRPELQHYRAGRLEEARPRRDAQPKHGARAQ